MRDFWGKLSVSSKLYALVGVMALLITLELGTLYFAMDTLSAVRSFVTGEALWSKAQKAAVASLKKYASSFDPKDYQEFQEYLKVPLGDRSARLEMLKDDFNYDKAFHGFVQGRVDPNDIPGVIRLFTRFHDVGHLKEAVKIWQDADVLIFSLMAEAEILKRMGELPQDRRDKKMIHASVSRINDVDSKLTILEEDFSYTLGKGSRWLENLLMVTLVLAVLMVESLGLFLTFSFSRQLSKSLNELNKVAQHVTEGDYKIKAPIHSMDELGRLAQSLNKMTEALEQSTEKKVEAENANLLKTMFLANMSHEIRTPLGAIVGFSELLRDPSLPAHEREHYISVIQKTGASLTKIINDILDISKVEAGRLKIEKNNFNLRELLDEVYAVLNLKAVEKEIDLEFGSEGIAFEQVYGDSVRLRQILINVIGNAIKFTEPGGQVSVRYFQKEAKLIFVVRDTGIGIAPHRQGELFQVFNQVDSYLTKRYQGTGLGLALSKKLAQMLDGDIRLLSSEISKGSVFEIQVGLESAIQLTSSLSSTMLAALSEDAIFKDREILLVEDSLDNQVLVQKLFSRYGFKFDVVNNGQEALDAALSKGYDLILMDMQMPVMDGYEATRRLRASGYRNPIVALTAHAMKEDREQCLRAGCDEYLTKPVNVVLTLKILAQILEKFDMNRKKVPSSTSGFSIA